MSLIADALRKAQSAKLGRRYASPEPSGVLPKGGPARRSGGESALGALFGRIQISRTLLIGLGSGALLFVALYSYFFVAGGGLRGSSGGASSVAVGNRSAGLILNPPPSVASVEPLILEDTAPAAKAGKIKVAPQPEGQDEKIEPKPIPAPPKAKALPSQARPSAQPEEGAKEAPPPKVAVTPQLSEEIRQQFNLALFYQEEKNFLQARRAYEKAVQMWPLYVEAHNNLGVVYKELGMYDQAIVQLKKALALNPRYTMAHHNLGVIYQLQGDWKQSVKGYEAALALDRSHLSSYNNLGLVYRAQKRAHEAREVLEKALAINPVFPQTHYNLALVLEEIREPERARFHFQKFIDLSGDGNQALVHRVRAHLQEANARQ
jgi:Flp pilus assembly protein TadD